MSVSPVLHIGGGRNGLTIALDDKMPHGSWINYASMQPCDPKPGDAFALEVESYVIWRYSFVTFAFHSSYKVNANTPIDDILRLLAARLCKSLEDT